MLYMLTSYIFFGENLSIPKITHVHLSLMRIFRYNPERKPLDSKYDFLADCKKYYETVIYDCRLLGKQNIIIPFIGKLRSGIDVNGVDVDPFLFKLHDYYSQLAKNHKLFLTPHYPCVVDILASKDENYHIELSKLPGSLSSCSEPKLSIALRIYPAGLASVRLGLFLQTATSFQIQDIIDFLAKRNAVITMGSQPYNIDKLTKEFARRLSAGLLNDQQTIYVEEGTSSMVSIIGADPHPTFQNNSADVFLPLLCLNMHPDSSLPVTGNLAKDPDVFIVGGRGNAVFFIPENIEDEREIDRRKLRRWIRNVFELYALQNFIHTSIVSSDVYTDFQLQLSKENWIKKLKKGILPPSFNSLFSDWNYVHLHQQDFPLQKAVWKTRYAEILKVLDPDDAIKKSDIQARTLLDNTVQQAAQDSKDVSSWLQKLIDEVGKIVQLPIKLPMTSSQNTS
jgi:hypothetical protein